MIFSGSARKFGDNIDTDLIIPARHLSSSDPAFLASHLLEDADAGFAASVRVGDILVAGKNFGCGSSREHAPIAIKASGISLVVAESFARIFYRNAVNIGLPILECEGAGRIADGDILRIDTEKGIIFDEASGEELATQTFPDFITDIIEKGGLLSSCIFTKK